MSNKVDNSRTKWYLIQNSQIYPSSKNDEENWYESFAELRLLAAKEYI